MTQLDDRQRARAETIDHLATHKIHAHPGDTDADLDDTLDSIARFEQELERVGGDPYIDDQTAAGTGQDAAVQLPLRDSDESLADYRLKVEAATDRLRHR